MFATFVKMLLSIFFVFARKSREELYFQIPHKDPLISIIAYTMLFRS